MTPSQLGEAITEMGYHMSIKAGHSDFMVLAWLLGEERPSAGLYAHSGKTEREALHRKCVSLRATKWNICAL